MKIVLSAALLASLLTAGCASTVPPDILPLAHPADPSAGSAGTAYQSVLGDFNRRQPADPKDWRQLNDRLSPARAGQGT